MAKQTYTQIVESFIVSQGFTSLPSYILDLDISQVNKEIDKAKAAYRATLDNYFNGDKKLFDKAAIAWHNLGLIIDFQLTTNKMVERELNDW